MDIIRILQNHGYLLVFFGLLLEYLGLPLPGELILFFIGGLVYFGRLELGIVLATALTAVLIGDHFWYFAGRRGGKRWLRFFCRATLGSAHCMSRTERFFHRYGPASLLFAKFVPGFRTFATPMTGMASVPYRRFLVFDLIGSVIWLISVTSLGMLTATQVGLMENRLGRLRSVLGSILAISVLIFLSLRLRKRLKYGEPKLHAQKGRAATDGGAENFSKPTF